MPASGRPAKAEAICAAVRIRGRQAEGAEATRRALLALHVGLAEAGSLCVTLAESVIVALAKQTNSYFISSFLKRIVPFHVRFIVLFEERKEKERKIERQKEMKAGLQFFYRVKK